MNDKTYSPTNLYDNAVGGVIIERLDGLKKSQSEICDITGISKSVLNDVVKGKRNLTAEMAVLLESAIGISADHLMTIQYQNELEKARSNDKVIAQITQMESWQEIEDCVSIADLKKRHVISGNIKQDVPHVFSIFGVKDVDEFRTLRESEETQTLFKRSEKLSNDEKAVFTWKHLCYSDSVKIDVDCPYSKNLLDTTRDKLKDVFYENKNTLKGIGRVLGEAGIRFMIREKFGQVPVDGMSFWRDDHPTIVVTLRLKNIDNLAFTVLHELAHIVLHLRKDEGVSFINMENEKREKVELEADQYAQDTFVSQEDWKSFMNKNAEVNPYAIHTRIAKFAEELRVNPQILFGRYMHDTGLYRLRRVFSSEIK
ncbi:MAG: helix-turn-helix domain-containing protein [Paludibacteraceae bacterium]|nr:helix-turn-helix domain-containing protein [Paludibacteraceae bacterium]